MRVALLGAVLLTGGLGCDAWLVGGECLPGYELSEGRCLVAASADGGGGGSAAGGAEQHGGGAQQGSGAGPGSGGSGVGGADPCADDLTSCAGQCVDVAVHPLHCGACGLVCPTGICEDGVCIGGAAGHVIGLGLDLQDAAPGGQVARVLGNAVFLHAGDPVRVVALKPTGLVAGASYLESLVASEAELRGRAHTYSKEHPDHLPAMLEAAQIDVLLVLGDALGRPAEIPDWASALQPGLPAFFQHGGVVVAVATAKNPDPITTFLDASLLLPGVSVTALAPGSVTVAAWTDALAVGLLSPFQMTGTPVSIGLADPSQAVVVLEDGAAAPVVVHRAVTPVR